MMMMTWRCGCIHIFCMKMVHYGKTVKRPYNNNSSSLFYISVYLLPVFKCNFLFYLVLYLVNTWHHPIVQSITSLNAKIGIVNMVNDPNFLPYTFFMFPSSRKKMPSSIIFFCSFNVCAVVVSAFSMIPMLANIDVILLLCKNDWQGKKWQKNLRISHFVQLVQTQCRQVSLLVGSPFNKLCFTLFFYLLTHLSDNFSAVSYCSTYFTWSFYFFFKYFIE